MLQIASTVDGLYVKDPLYLLSQKLFRVQIKWSTFEIEAYASHYAMQKLKYFKANRHFIVKTDHRSLLDSFLRKQEIPNTNLQRWFDNFYSMSSSSCFSQILETFR